MNPFDITEAIGQAEVGARVLTLGGAPHDHAAAAAGRPRRHGPVAVLHFDAHLDTWDTSFGAYTHGTPFRRASEEGPIDREHSVHVGIRGPLYAASDLADDAVLGFQVISRSEVESIGVTGLIEQMHARLGGESAYVSLDIDVLEPAHAPGTPRRPG